MIVNSKELCENVDPLLDLVLDTGVPIEVTRRGRTLRISVTQPNERLSLPEAPAYALAAETDDPTRVEWPD